MGDRVLIQFKDERGEVSPIIYAHWAGSDAPAALVRLRERMADRPGDCSYVAARCLQELGMDDVRSTGFGIWCASKELTPDDSHGDAGIFVVELGETWHVHQFAGYGFEPPDCAGIVWECERPETV